MLPPIHHRLPEARRLLTARAQYLETLDEEDPVTHHALAATHYLLQHYSKALSHARKAVERDPGNRELLWHLQLVSRQNKVVQDGAEKLVGLASSEHLKMPKPTQVCDLGLSGLGWGFRFFLFFLAFFLIARML